MVVIDSNNSILYSGILWHNSMKHYYIIWNNSMVYCWRWYTIGNIKEQKLDYITIPYIYNT